MRIKLWKYSFIEKLIFDLISKDIIKKNIWDYKIFVYRKGKYKEQVEHIIRYTDSIAFQRKIAHKLDQQSIYSPFEEFYDVEMELLDLFTLMFSLGNK